MRRPAGASGAAGVRDAVARQIGVTIPLDMDKGRHPKVVRTWMTGKVRTPPRIPKTAPLVVQKPQAHNNKNMTRQAPLGATRRPWVRALRRDFCGNAGRGDGGRAGTDRSACSLGGGASGSL